MASPRNNPFSSKVRSRVSTKPLHPHGQTRTQYEILVSACLTGIRCTNRGGDNLKPSLKQMVDEGRALAVCPEVLGGLTVPRESSEIAGGDGSDVLAGRAAVLTRSGKDVSRYFIDGARAALRYAKKYQIGKAILKSNSPSCGTGHIYDGRFRKVLKSGSGVTASLLQHNKIEVFTEKDFPHAK